MPSTQELESALFALALEKPLTERPAFLQAVCRKDNAPRRVTESLERLVQLYDAWGKPTQAVEWKQKLAAFQHAAKAVEKKETQP